MTDSVRAAKPRTAKIPLDQLDLPVSFDPSGAMVTLREVLDGKPALPLAALDPEQRTALVLERLERQPGLELAMVGAGFIDRSRALLEVKAGTEAGRALSEIEEGVVQGLLDEVGADARRIHA
ncbi:MAG: hypothetical protein K2W96_18965 [Gemmataceae bacterium]|nr:hypothetical protein [Gemmataceae bacterium]